MDQGSTAKRNPEVVQAQDMLDHAIDKLGCVVDEIQIKAASVLRQGPSASPDDTTRETQFATPLAQSLEALAHKAERFAFNGEDLLNRIEV